MQAGSEAVKRRLETMRARYGETYYRDLGKRFAEEKLQSDPEYYVKLGELGGPIGGNVTRERYGHEHYVAIGQKSAQKRRERKP